MVAVVLSFIAVPVLLMFLLCVLSLYMIIKCQIVVVIIFISCCEFLKIVVVIIVISCCEYLIVAQYIHPLAHLVLEYHS